MSKQQLTPTQEHLIDFFSPVEMATLTRQFKQIFRTAAFESEMSENEDGRDALFSLYHLIELMETNN